PKPRAEQAETTRTAPATFNSTAVPSCHKSPRSCPACPPASVQCTAQTAPPESFSQEPAFSSAPVPNFHGPSQVSCTHSAWHTQSLPHPPSSRSHLPPPLSVSSNESASASPLPSGMHPAHHCEVRYHSAPPQDNIRQSPNARPQFPLYSPSHKYCRQIPDG